MEIFRIIQTIFLLMGIHLGWTISSVYGRFNDPDEMFRRLLREFEQNAANLTEEMLHISKPVPLVGYTEFDCPPSASPTVPTSVNLLRPGDFRVIGAIGDSLTAAYAAGANTFVPLMFEYPGLSASVGGDKTLDEIITLPNIFRMYNPHLYGYSTGLSVIYTNPPNKRFNVAISGAISSDMPGQARELVAKMKNDPNIDFDNDWKFVTLFIGGNDVCSGCIDPTESSPERIVENVEKALQIFYNESPRTFVNILSLPLLNQIVQVRPLSLICTLMISYYCPCVLGGKVPEDYVKLKCKEYQHLLGDSIRSGQFDKEDFAVVYEPFMEKTLMQYLPNGDIDMSFFAPDCFHLSQKGQAAMAIANWNNLFQPVGSKGHSYVPDEILDCPSTEFPYLYTNANSKPGFLEKYLNSSRPGSVPNRKTSTSEKLLYKQP